MHQPPPANATGAPAHRHAVLLAILVTVLWSSSWVLIKLGMDDRLPPLTFAGLRYALAFLVLVPSVLGRPENRAQLRGLDRRGLSLLAALGVAFYTLTQGGIFLSLAFLDATLVSLLWSLSPILVAVAGALWLQERMGALQAGGIAVCILGAALYFLPSVLPQAALAGLVFAAIGVAANALASVLGRGINRERRLAPSVVTLVSMGIGGTLLLAVGLISEGLGKLSMSQIAILAWLAVVNTALAFTLWNQSLRTLTAVESSILNGLMVPQIALLAVIFLGERLSPGQWAGLLLVAVGGYLVQRPAPPAA